MIKPGPTKMKDVAQRAGVSLMAVSLALREDEASINRLGSDTRERILQAARELSYSPNARARVLRSGVTNVIGLYAGYGFVNVRLPFFTEIVSGLQDGCEQFGKDLLLHGTFRNRSTDAIWGELRDGRIDGLIVNIPLDDPLAQLLAQSHLPVVAIADALPHIPSVVADDAGGARLIVRHLKARGYRDCCYLDGGVGSLSSVRRRAAFIESAARNGVSVEELTLTKGSHADENLMSHWRQRSPSQRPRAIVCWNDTTAYDVLAQCRALDIAVPGEVAIIGFDGCPTDAESYWNLSTVRAPWAKIAQTAVELLNESIAGRSIAGETVLPVEWLEGQTS